MSVIVNSAEPSAPVEHVWSEEELRAGLESFEAALIIWRNEKGYDPRGGPKAEIRRPKEVRLLVEGHQPKPEGRAPVLVA
jgi:hypothetical protein